jgi:NifU-like protein involved in Fe-S cluster formation
VDADGSAASRYAPATVDHFQHPRNVGRLANADALGYVDDAATETTISVYVAVAHGRVARATFRTFGCSACVAASSAVTELIIGRPVAQGAAVSAEQVDRALGGLPADKRYCAELAAEAARRALDGLGPRLS